MPVDSPFSPRGPDAGALDAWLRAFLPGARLERAGLPLVPELDLWLINADYPVGPLPPEVARQLMEDPPYWAFCWGSGAVLARWLLDHPDSVRGRTVLDFGAGSGVVAVAAALAGARRAVACDLDGRSLQAARANAQLNGVQVETCADYFAFAGDIDLILAADVLYDRDNLAFLEKFRARSAGGGFARAGFPRAGLRALVVTGLRRGARSRRGRMGQARDGLPRRAHSEKRSMNAAASFSTIRRAPRSARAASAEPIASISTR